MTAAPSPAPLAPDVRPFAEIARGPVASVFKAFDRTTGETVLLKSLRPTAAADPERRARFAAEARLAATVDHPNVVRVRHVADDGALLVADWIEGADLQATLDAHGALPAALAVYVAREALRGLAAVHASGILHRDGKAANVLLGADGTVRLTDFGLASLAPDGDEANGEVRGTLATLAPEIVQGAPPAAASDVFSLGAVLVQALTGRAPFAAATASATLDAVLHTDVDALLAADPRVPPAVAAVAAAMLARDPALRPSAAEAADHLDALGPDTAVGLAAWLADPSAYRPPPLAETAPSAFDEVLDVAPTRHVRRHRGWTAIGAAALALIVIVLWVRRPAPPPAAKPAPTVALEAPAPVQLVPPSDSSVISPPSTGDPLVAVPGAATTDAPPTPLTDAPPAERPPAPRAETPVAAGPAPPSPTAERPPAPEAPGQLVVVAEPWAAVRVDGRAVGTTPVVPLTLPAGVHEVTFENPAFPTHTVTVRVAPGETVRAEVSLWTLVARVHLDVTPWAEVWVDGRRWDTVPPQERPLVLPPGAHTLAFVHPTLGRREVPLRVTAGEERTVRVRLADGSR